MVPPKKKDLNRSSKFSTVLNAKIAGCYGFLLGQGGDIAGVNQQELRYFKGLSPNHDWVSYKKDV